MVKASSLYESILAITIITITIGAATLIFSNLLKSQRDIAYYQLLEKIDSIKIEGNNKNQFKNKTFDFKQYNVIQNVSSYKNIRGLKLLKFRITRKGKKIKTINYLILSNE